MLNINSTYAKTIQHSEYLWYYACLALLKRTKHKYAINKVSTKELYQTLGVDENCEDETLRLAFVHLAKRFHPDSGAPEASAVRFSEIESAYRNLRRIRNELKEEASGSTYVEEFDIKHTAPQHRHYLVYDVGIGTPSKRQRLHTIERAQKAADSVMEHRLQKLQAEERNSLVGMDKQRAKDIKTRFGMDRLVEDLIQEAMSKGEFNDLPGMGKPLKENANARNPYVDFVTHKLNQILIDNGFTPEWIQLSKEIREETEELRKRLTKKRCQIGSCPLSLEEVKFWEKTLESYQESVKKINNKIDKYNLLVPILQKQMLHIKLEDLAEQVLSKPPAKQIEKSTNKSTNSDNIDLFSALFSVFSKKR